MIEENAKIFLFELDDIFKSINLRYFLYAGTCLGAVRNNTFIPIDLDIDVACYSEEFEPKAKELAFVLDGRGFWTEWIDHRHKNKWDGRVYAIKCSKYGIRCDIVSLMPKGKYRFNPSHIDTPIFVHTADYVNELEEINFYGRKFLIPKQPERFLEEHYGKDWKIPHTKFYEGLDVFPTAKFPKGDDDYWWANE